jgi:phosphatidylglycerol---prolipoprotein diacylglyceryl transferase
MWLSLAISFVFFYRMNRKTFSILKIISIFIGAVIVMILGARGFYLAFEKDYSQVAFTLSDLMNFRGMTFYGSFLVVTVYLYLVSLKVKAADKQNFWLSAIYGCLVSYVFLRVGCFTIGCCWGKITPVAWAVQYYHPASVMPWKGIPVHPVQLYDAFYSLILLFTFLLMKNKKLVPLLFFILFPLGRIITEFYRGDAYRGEDLLMNLSTSQLISLGIIMITTLTVFRQKLMKPAFALLSLVLLTSCLPKEPGSSKLKLVKDYQAKHIELYKINNNELIQPAIPKGSPYYKEKINNRNMIFVALDDTVQPQFQPLIQAAYKTDEEIRIEDITWWRFAGSFRFMYDYVIKIPHTDFNAASLTEAIRVAEVLGKPYDLYILTHGIPNHLTSTKGQPLISYKDIAELGKYTKNLNIVYLQACFGVTLAKDFMGLGASHLIAFEGFNRNFFYIDFFIDELRKNNFDVLTTYEELNDEIDEKMQDSLLYKKVLPGMGLTHEQYMKISPSPIIFVRE